MPNYELQDDEPLIAALKDAVDLPIHFHTHDTSGAAIATIMAATEAGVDCVDAAMVCVVQIRTTNIHPKYFSPVDIGRILIAYRIKDEMD